jgi:hypothetical protein
MYGPFLPLDTWIDHISLLAKNMRR